MARRSHEVDYQIHGDDLQFVEVELDPGETVIGEAGAMMFLDSGVTFEVKMGDGAEPDKGLFGRLKDAGKRALAQESIFITHFTNTGRGKQVVAFSTEFPGRIVPIDLEDLGGEIIAQKDAFLCAALGTKIDIAFRRNLGVGLFGGEGFILQRLEGDGMAFLSVGGTVIEKRLEGDKLLVDSGCLVAMEPGIDYDIQRAGNLKSQFFGGEGSVPREPLRARPGLAAVDAVLAAGRAHPEARTRGAQPGPGRRFSPQPLRDRGSVAPRPGGSRAALTPALSLGATSRYAAGVAQTAISSGPLFLAASRHSGESRNPVPPKFRCASGAFGARGSPANALTPSLSLGARGRTVCVLVSLRGGRPSR